MNPDKKSKNNAKNNPKYKKNNQEDDNSDVIEIPDDEFEFEKTNKYERKKMLNSNEKQEIHNENSKNSADKGNSKKTNEEIRYGHPEKAIPDLKTEILEALSEKHLKAIKECEEKEEKEKRKEEAIKILEKNGKIRPKRGWKKRDYLEVGLMPPQSKFKPIIFVVAFLAGAWFLVNELMHTDISEEEKSVMTLSKYQMQIDELKAKTEQLFKQQMETKLKLEIAEKQIADAQKKLVEHDGKIKANRDSITESEGKIKEIDGELLKLTKDVDKNRDEIRKLNEEKEKIENELENLKKADEELMKRQEELDNQHNELKKQQDEIDKQVKENTKSINELKLTQQEFQRLKKYLEDRGIIPKDFDYDFDNLPEDNQP